MAVTEIKNPSTLKIKLNLGLVDGKEKTRSKSYSYLKPKANLQDVYDVGQALMELQKYDVTDIIKIDNTTLQDPRGDISESEIKDVMDLIVSKNIFASNGLDLVSAVEAKVVVTETTPFDLIIG